MTEQQPNRRTQVRLTARDLSAESGAALLQRLEQVWTDGVISKDDIDDLAAWLNEAASVTDIPAPRFLREEVSGLPADGIVSEPEKRLLREAILRVLPVAERERARARFAESAERAREARKRESLAAADRATPSQLEYIRALGGTCPDGASKAEASGIVDAILGRRPTVRQRMVLRFWNRLDLLQAGVDGVSTWLDERYAEDPDPSEAWGSGNAGWVTKANEAQSMSTASPLGAATTIWRGSRPAAQTMRGALQLLQGTSLPTRIGLA